MLAVNMRLLSLQVPFILASKIEFSNILHLSSCYLLLTIYFILPTSLPPSFVLFCSPVPQYRDKYDGFSWACICHATICFHHYSTTVNTYLLKSHMLIHWISPVSNWQNSSYQSSYTLKQLHELGIVNVFSKEKKQPKRFAYLIYECLWKPNTSLFYSSSLPCYLIIYHIIILSIFFCMWWPTLHNIFTFALTITA